jgi:pyrroloquinoline quinone (PQQ) biosynthesis protein C
MDLAARIDALRERWNVLHHSFYVRWQAGELSPRELGVYAGEYRHAVVALAGAAAAGGDAEHAGEEASHVGLWDAFADAVDGADAPPPLPETSQCAAAWAGATDTGEANAILYAIEGAQPAIARTKLDGLVAHYGFRGDEPATEYFRLHAELDHEHAAHASAALADVAPEDADRVVGKAEAALAGNWALLDGVEAAAR